MKMNIKQIARFALIGVTATALVACGGSDDDDNSSARTASFDVTVTNGTLAQPLSPIAVVAHTDGFAAFTIGEPATVGLEILAEGGDNSAFLAGADADANVFSTASGSSPVGPGNTSTVSIEVSESELANLKLSVVSMLVNTNDAMTALKAMDVSSLAVGDSLTARTLSYDSGTEANTEAAGTIPGPIDGGEGFNAERDDIADQVRGHGGVVTTTGGLSTSVLGQEHRWDNPVTVVTVTRSQ